jgi:hydroxymethylbilane synthase
LEIHLLHKKIDIAVHSLKDLQTEIPDGLKLAAVTKRHDVEDVLIARKKRMTIWDLPEGGTVATGSLRRRSQLKHLRPDLNIVELRGNVPTRIQKFLDSDWDGIILARAGVERLKLKKHISSYIPIETMLPAVGQGALGIEINEENKFAEEILAAINHTETEQSVLAERALLKELEGGCQVPIGAYAEVKSNGLFLDALVGSIDGSVTYRQKLRGSKNEPVKLGKKLARNLLRAGAKEILTEVYETARK